MSSLYIGTSGWMYGDWQGAFYPQDLPKKKWLEYYSQHFKTVEVNSTFYHSMRPLTFKNWAKTVSSNFVFSIKGSRFIIHIKRFKNVSSSIVQTIEPASVLGKKLGPILFQLPPRFKADAKRLEAFLVLCYQFTVNRRKKSVNSELSTVNLSNRLAFEFRDASWFDKSIYQILRKHNAALVIAESGGYPTSPRELRGARWPSEEVITADFTYIRFHGEGGSYSTSYTDKELLEWAKKIKKWQKVDVNVYVYFNNDVGGFAVENAKTLMSMI